jgi:curli biogenesis system outer membrane secretion channel CsgG
MRTRASFGPVFAVLAAVLVWPAWPASATPYGGLKKTVAVYQFDAAAAGGATTADALVEMLTDALVRDGRFVVVERADIANIATEQQLGTQASTTAETSAHSGQMIGASLIINGTVTKYQPNANSNSLSIGGLPIGGSLSGGRAVIAISLRVINSTTGQVLATVSAQGAATTHDMQLSTTAANGASVTADSVKATPLGQAAEDAISKAVPQIELAADHLPWSAQVIEVDDGKVYVNAGSDENLQPGAVLHVRRKIKDLVDPGTGAILDTLISDIGTIRIDAVRAKTSTAVIVDGPAPLRGDLLQSE